MAKKVLITGATGLVGSRLTTLLQEQNYQVSYLSRHKTIIPQIPVYKWDIKSGVLEEEALQKADYIVHLAGAGVADKRWSDKRKEEILKSRTESTHLLYKKIKEMTVKPKAFISASAVGIYGLDTKDELLTENSKQGSGFLSEVTKAWEDEVDTIASLGVRTVKLRIGIVLSAKGGALQKMAQPVQYGVGAPLASGKQYLSWIHIDDLCRMFQFAMENDTIQGAYNAVGHHPATNKELTKAIAKTLKRPLFMPSVPEFALKLMLGEMAQMVIGGNKVSNQKITDSGFSFKFKELSDALNNLLNK